MHKKTLVALSWCFLIAAATVLILEVHRSHAGVTPPTVMAAQMPSRGMLLAPPETATVSSPVAQQATTAAANYAGNVSTHKFHRMTCRFASCKNCTVHFATRDEALAAGFRPGGCCDP